MLIVQITAIVLFLIIGIYRGRRAYLGFTEEEKEKFKDELKKPFLTILFNTLGYIGYVVLFLGIILGSSMLKCIGLSLIGLGLIVDGAEVMSTAKNGILLIIFGSILFLGSVFYVFKPYWAF